jgi:hypothetical protein
MKKYQEFKPKFFTWTNMLVFLLGIVFGDFAYEGGNLAVAVFLAVLYVGTFLVSNRVAFNKDNIEALHEEIEELKKNK